MRRNNFFIFLFLVVSVALNAQKITVYKIDGLLRRINNTSDTTYIVNFWATWCKPCVEELPEFEKLNLNKDTINKKIKVLLVTLDFKEDLKKRVKPFVKNKKLTCEVALLDEVNGNDFINKISPSWSGAIPATYVVKNGKTVFHEGKINYGKLLELLSKIEL